MTNIDLNDAQIKLTIFIKTLQLKKNGLANLDIEEIKVYLFGYRWKKHKPATLHEAVNDILSINGSQLVAYLSTRAIVESKNKNLGDFKNLLEGE